MIRDLLNLTRRGSVKPNIIRIVPDEHHFRHVGWTDDGRQFILTEPFVAEREDNPGREFLALYLFDNRGALLNARIEDLGTRALLDVDGARATRSRWLGQLGRVRSAPIAVHPFEIEHFSVAFGLIPQGPEDDDEEWCVCMQPGDYAAFTPPWDGRYDT